MDKNINIDKLWIIDLWSYACSGDIRNLKKYYADNRTKNLRYNRFGKEHSLIMGAYRNNQFDTVLYLLSVGETITNDEKEELESELKRIEIIKEILS